MQAAQITDVQVERPREYRVSPQWQPSVQESCVNRYRMVVEPLSFSTERASFSWRAPGSGTIMSPNVFLEVQFDVTTQGQQDLQTMLSPTWQCADTDPQTADANQTRDARYADKVSFGSQDAFGNSITNYMLTINGASLTQSRMNLYKTTLDRTWFGESVFQRRFSCCGGAPDAYDATAVSGANVVDGIGAGRAIQGFTADSGITKRIKNYLNCTTGVVNEGVAEDGRCRKRILVRWPVHGVGVFSPIGASSADVVGPTCPYRRSAYGLCHINVASLDILFKDMKECLFRNLSRTVALAGSDGNAAAGIPGDGTRGTNRAGGGVLVELVPSTAKLNLEYLRLASFRGIPASINLSVYRIAVHTASKETHGNAAGQAIPAASTRGSINRDLPNALICIGDDATIAATVVPGGKAKHASFYQPQLKTLTAEWNGIVSAQVPAQLVFLLQKNSEVYILGSDAAGDRDDGDAKAVNDWAYTAGIPATARGTQAGLDNYFLCRNTDSSASIERISLEIQSSVGAYTFADDAFPYIKTRQQLFRDHLRYCVDGAYQGDFDKWSRHCCCLVLGADSFIRGLATPGSSFPISINAKVEFASRRQYVDGHAFASEGGGGGAQLAVLRDCIQGTPVMLECFPSGSLSLTASSGILSSQNLGHSQAQDIVSGRSKRGAE